MVLIFPGPLTVAAQQTAKVYVEGKNWVLDEQYAGASMERLASLAPEQYRQAAAKTLGLTIPASLLLRADQVIE